MQIIPKKDPEKGELISIQTLARKAEVSETYVKRLIQKDYVMSHKIGGRRFIYYRDFLRGVWAYEQDKKKTGPKNEN